MNVPDRDDTVGLEALLLAARRAAPPPAMRDRVLAAMDLAAVERGAMLAAHRRGEPARPERERRQVPEAIAGVAAALVVVVMAWSGGGRVGVDAVPLDLPAARSTDHGEDPPDLHRALELLDARRGHFAGLVDAVASLPN